MNWNSISECSQLIHAFGEYMNLKRISILSSIISIEKGSFSEYSSLPLIIISFSGTTIGD